MKDIRLPSNWVSLIMDCLQSNAFRICWNGDVTDELTPSRGIRQGDSLSPYFFVLCIERLSHIINAATEASAWIPIQVSRQGPTVSYLYFLDDIVLFAKATVNQINVIKGCLDMFCASLGQKLAIRSLR